MAQLSKAEKLLVAAGHLVEKGQTDFSAEDLAVEAHKLFPHDFAMKGHPQHPDSNIVFTQVMGKKAPLIVRGWLEKTGTKQYRLTSKGLSGIEALGLVDLDIASVRLDRKFEDSLARLLTSSAYQLFKDGKESDITFHQFCRFANLSARDKWQKVCGKLKSLEYIVQEAAKIGRSGEGISIYVGNHNEKISPEDLLLLDALFRLLPQRFRNEMEEWKRHASA